MSRLNQGVVLTVQLFIYFLLQITSLVSLHFLGHASGEDQIEQPKYKCLVSLDFIKTVSR